MADDDEDKVCTECGYWPVLTHCGSCGTTYRSVQEGGPDVVITGTNSVTITDPDPKLPVQVIVDAPVERTTLGRIHTHTAPDPTPEPAAGEIREWLEANQGYRSYWGRWQVSEMLEAREALLAERRTPPVEVPAVYLPDDGHWKVGGTVTVLLHAPPTAERVRWRPYSSREGS